MSLNLLYTYLLKNPVALLIGYEKNDQKQNMKIILLKHGNKIPLQKNLFSLNYLRFPFMSYCILYGRQQIDLNVYRFLFHYYKGDIQIKACSMNLDIHTYASRILQLISYEYHSHCCEVEGKQVDEILNVRL